MGALAGLWLRLELSSARKLLGFAFAGLGCLLLGAYWP